MIVSKCDNCGIEYHDGDFPEWIQITAEHGVMIVNSKKSVIKYGLLDFCSSECARDFLKTLVSAMEPVNDS